MSNRIMESMRTTGSRVRIQLGPKNDPRLETHTELAAKAATSRKASAKGGAPRSSSSKKPSAKVSKAPEGAPAKKRKRKPVNNERFIGAKLQGFAFTDSGDKLKFLLKDGKIELLAWITAARHDLPTNEMLGVLLEQDTTVSQFARMTTTNRKHMRQFLTGVFEEGVPQTYTEVWGTASLLQKSSGEAPSQPTREEWKSIIETANAPIDAITLARAMRVAAFIDTADKLTKQEVDDFTKIAEDKDAFWSMSSDLRETVLSLLEKHAIVSAEELDDLWKEEDKVLLKEKVRKRPEPSGGSGALQEAKGEAKGATPKGSGSESRVAPSSGSMTLRERTAEGLVKKALAASAGAAVEESKEEEEDEDYDDEEEDESLEDEVLKGEAPASEAPPAASPPSSDAAPEAQRAEGSSAVAAPSSTSEEIVDLRSPTLDAKAPDSNLSAEPSMSQGAPSETKSTEPQSVYEAIMCEDDELQEQPAAAGSARSVAPVLSSVQPAAVDPARVPVSIPAASVPGVQWGGIFRPFENPTTGFWLPEGQQHHWYPRGSRCFVVNGVRLVEGMTTEDTRRALVDEEDKGPRVHKWLDMPAEAEEEPDQGEERTSESRQERASDSEGYDSPPSEEPQSSQSSEPSVPIPELKDAALQGVIEEVKRRQDARHLPHMLDPVHWQQVVARSLVLWKNQLTMILPNVHPTRVNFVKAIDLASGSVVLHCKYGVGKVWEEVRSEPLGVDERKDLAMYQQSVPLALAHPYAEAIADRLVRQGRPSASKLDTKAHFWRPCTSQEEIVAEKALCGLTEVLLCRVGGKLETCTPGEAHRPTHHRYRVFRAVRGIAKICGLPADVTTSADIMQALEGGSEKWKIMALLLRALFRGFDTGTPLSDEEKKQVKAWEASAKESCPCQGGDKIAAKSKKRGRQGEGPRDDEPLPKRRETGPLETPTTSQSSPSLSAVPTHSVLLPSASRASASSARAPPGPRVVPGPSSSLSRERHRSPLRTQERRRTRSRERRSSERSRRSRSPGGERRSESHQRGSGRRFRIRRLRGRGSARGRERDKSDSERK